MRTFLKRSLSLIMGIFLSSLLIILASCSQQEDTLASYQGGEITADEFLTRYNNYLQSTGLEDNLPDRKKILRSALHEELILQDWQSKSLDESPATQAILRQQEEQAILDAWWREMAPDPGQADPQTLAIMLINEETRFKILESHHGDHETALLAREALLRGRSIPERDLGYISLEDVHARLAKDIQVMEVGEISLPIRMGNSYSLIRLADKRIPPMIRPQDFAAARERLQREWQVNQVDSVMNTYTEGVLSDLNVRFDEDGVKQLFQILINSPRSELAAKITESGVSEMPVCSTSDGEWTLASLVPHLQATRSDHLTTIIDLIDLEKVISGILVRNEMISRARGEMVHSRPETVETIKKRQNLWRIKEWQEVFADTVSITREYLASQTDGGIADTSVVFREVIAMAFDDRVSAENYRIQQLNLGSSVNLENFGEEFAPDMPAGGRLGWVSKENLGQAAPTIFGYELQTWTESWQYSDRYFVFNSLAEKRVEITADEQLQDLERQVRMAGAPVQLQKALTAMEKVYDAKIYEERIKEIPYIQLSGTSNES